MPVYNKPVSDKDILSMSVYGKPIYDEDIFNVVVDIIKVDVNVVDLGVFVVGGTIENGDGKVIEEEVPPESDGSAKFSSESQ